MFPHQPSRLPDTVTTPQRSSRARPRPGRRRCCPGVAGLEDRILLNGHTLETATPLAFTANRTATISGFLASPKDVDLFALALEAGDTVTAAVDAQKIGTGLDSALRVFDGQGLQIAFNNDFDGRDPRLTFQAPASGTYYMGVSGAGNLQYNPQVQGGGDTLPGGIGASTGLYQLHLSKTNAPLLPDLVGASFEVAQDSALWGEPVTIHYMIENRGGAAAGPFQVDLRLADHNRFDGSQPLLATFSVDGLAAGTAATGTLTVTLPGTPGAPPDSFTEPEQVFVGLQIDSDDAVTESNEGNNSSQHLGTDWASLPILTAQQESEPNDAVAMANDIPLNSRTAGTLAPGDVDFYRISPTEDGRLSATVHSQGAITRLSLLDSQGRVLLRSDGQSPGDPDDLIDLHVPAGTDYLKVENLRVAGAYTLTTTLTPATTPFQPISVGSWPNALVAGDFNRDGRPDLAVAKLPNDVSVLLNNGDGTFQDQMTYTVGTGPMEIVAGDFNRDGRTDLAVANHYDNDVSVLLGNGDGTFQNQMTYTVGDSPDAIVAGDFNGDGWTDLAVANEFDNDVSVLLGNGDGTFQNQKTYTVGDWPSAIVAGDFNGDGHTDLAVANEGSIAVLLGNGDGTFQDQKTYTVGNWLEAIVAGDFNGDGHTDLAVANESSIDVSVLLGNGDGTFQSQVHYTVGGGPDAIVADDFNGDGWTDLAVANMDDPDVSVLLGNGDGTFQDQKTYTVGDWPSAIVAGDFNGDGRTDPAVGNIDDNDVSVLLNNGHGTFADPGQFSTTPHATPEVADLNGDGTDDVLVINAAGDILFRQGQSEDPGRFKPPVKVNPGFPARDIAYVVTRQGPVLAGVDARDGAVSLYVFRADGFVRIGSLPTGRLPAQIVSADLNGDGWDNLVVRNAGDGTLTVFFNNGSGSDATGNDLFPSSVTLLVGLGVSDVTLADVIHDGATDIIVTNKLSGQVSILHNRGNGTFDPPAPYRAGTGLSDLDVSSGSAAITSREATAGVAAGRFRSRGPTDLVTINPGSNWFDVLTGLGMGRFANPVAFPTKTPARVVRVADFNRDGVSDIALLSADKVSVYLGDGKGGFLPPTSYDAGPDPTGLTVADINHDGNPDLLVGNSFGDVLVLLGNGNGTFQPYRKADQNVALAVLPNGSPTPDFIYADQGLDRVVVDYGGGQKTVVGDKSTGLLSPGAVKLADLNGDGIPDLIVANSGSNNVLIYPGLGNGQFGPALNGGHGFFTGTNPVGITVADVDGDGRPDLVVANKGSNDVSILLNRKQGNSITFIPGPRLKVGSGPVSTVVGDFLGNGKPDLLVSNSQSNNVMLLPGVGGGFFNDQNPTIFSVGSQPGPLFVGNFDGKPDILSVGSRNLTLISDFLGPHPVTTTISPGVLDPGPAFIFSSDSGFDNLVVAGDRTFALLEGGPDGLNLTSTETEPGLLNPTDLAFLAFTGGQVQFYAATEGSEAATLLTFQLGGETGMPTVPGLQPLHDAALPLIATLLTLTIETSTAEFNPGAFDGEAAAAVSFLPVTAGQSLLELASYGEGEGGDEQEPNEPKEPDLPVTQESSSWQPFLMGLDEALDQFCRDSLDQFMSRDEPAPDKAQPPHALSKPLNLWQRDQASPEARGTIGTDSSHLPQANQGQIIDEAIRSLWADESRPVRTSLTPTSVPLTSDGTTPAETAPADATLLSPEPVQRQDGPLLSSYERGFEALTEFAGSLLLAAFVARRIDPPSTRHWVKIRGRESFLKIRGR
ncbi:MAG: FG-GAP-like repeat-containing protein [Isosphaeraceae bacterium]